MTKLKKVYALATNYVHMAYGGALMAIYRNLPKHYLGHVIAEKTPIILIPEILKRWSFMKHLGDRISLTGHLVYIVPKLKYNIYNIPTVAQKVRELLIYIIPKLKPIAQNITINAAPINNLIKKHKKNIKVAILVAHNKGGLIGKYLLIHHNKNQRINGLVAIATPFSGSSMVMLTLITLLKK
ncbi:hypothetical protein COV23_00440 [Candidatus Wolfebacteria bacterium CG10_big_fil_rev_8_21_14_0_10_31_9]|uniref:Alpha/beta hydrolase n=1 Tax=Candidatus Wolfebacteria bacterium CG10_big_fil_rev_8_21_14_0_10_31_9 TaxID=1975070 RepID=A0A2H0RET2_9BACT|nr:MAG: hypothetical protein COV23_00440 [Candidatus Wolfebacteria bacterium CG10_big_fil_rev_8_21_14_0_10_31_9]